MNTQTTDTLKSSDVRIFERIETECRAYCRDLPVVFEKGSGSYAISTDGTRYLDFFSGAGALNYGHNHPKMIEAAMNYIAEGNILHGLDMFTTAKRELLEEIERTLLTPKNWDYKIQFTGPTGTDANEAALKLARLVTSRREIVAFRGSYHGMSIGSLSVSGSRKLRQAGEPLLNEVTFVPYEFGPNGKFDSIEYLNQHFGDSSGGNELPAAVIVEGVQIQAGVYAASSEWLRQLQKWTKANGVLLIVDEVQTGCGRTGEFFSFENSGIVPDIITVAKSIGGLGLPMAMVFLRRGIDAWKPGEHTGTFRGNQLAFVAGRVALQFWRDEAFLQLVNDNAETFASAMESMSSSTQILETRYKGLIGGIDFGVGETAKAQEFQRRAQEEHIIVERCGREGEVVKLMPPINTPNDVLIQGLEKLSRLIG
ncbi:diaminobutyrate--2-oxoglutarate transaminase [Glutamicibacter sp. JL.03c]|uniref:diaminobutyrate--2-oxoglutarate transaminase n=1 Tax=Glutamicibacter sp. JL.03c TaxID=2984842 RepID=UPI0021F7385F|nr:diaminobutyrate--2-oxoglutarate transaminase [Glutamicibacter sp. JL.03c]UYQ77500.1 diaminobutyrate--2-oxoglutarate transaminase [Glutamicibacter sp. JL.03c]